MVKLERGHPQVNLLARCDRRPAWTVLHESGVVRPLVVVISPEPEC